MICFRWRRELHPVSRTQQLWGRGRGREWAPSTLQHCPHRRCRGRLCLPPAGDRRDLRGLLQAAARQALGHPPPSTVAVVAHQPQAGRGRGHLQLQQQRLRAQRHHYPTADIGLSLLPALREGERRLRTPRLHRPGDAAAEPGQHLLQSMRQPASSQLDTSTSLYPLPTNPLLQTPQQSSPSLLRP